MKKLILFIILLLMPVAAFCQGVQYPAATTSDQDQVFDRIRQATAAIRTLAGEFIQEKHLDILKNAPVSKGRFFYKSPDCLRWEVLEPSSMGFIVKGDKGKRWKGRSGAMQPFDLKKEPVIQIISGQVFAWARADFKQLESGYDITVLGYNPVVLKLVPRSATEKKYLNHIRLAFSSTGDYVNAIEIHEAGGDYTLLTFINMAVNQPLEEDIF